MPAKEAWRYDVPFPRSRRGQTDTHTHSTSINYIDNVIDTLYPSEF